MIRFASSTLCSPTASRRGASLVHRLFFGLVRWIGNFTRLILYTVFFFILMVAASYWVASQFFGGREFTAPDLAGMSLEQAARELKDDRVSLLLDRTQPHPEIPEGHIVSQYPAPGTRIKSGTPMRVVISGGPPLVTLPDLRGLSRLNAGIRLRSLGFDVGNIARVSRPDVESDSVLATDPPGGTGVLSGAKVNLLISAGQSGVIRQMPNLIGLTLEEAGELLNQYDMVIARANPEPSQRVLAGQIHRQQPAPGDPLSPETRISVDFVPQRETYQPGGPTEATEPPRLEIEFDAQDRQPRSPYPPDVRR